MPTRLERLDSALTLLAVVIGLSVCGLGIWQVVEGIRGCDPKYYPIVAATIGGIGTLGGVLVAFLLLRFHQTNQLNPLRLELYKEQAKVVKEMYDRASELKEIYDIAEFYLQPSDKAKRRADFFNAMNACIDTMKRNSLYFPTHLTSLYVDMMNKFLTGIHQTEYVAVPLYADFVNACREQIGTDELSKGYMTLMHGRLNELQAYKSKSPPAE